MSKCASGDGDVLREIGFEIIANTYTKDGKGGDVDAFIDRMKSYGLAPLKAHKLYLYLRRKVLSCCSPKIIRKQLKSF